MLLVVHSVVGNRIRGYKDGDGSQILEYLIAPKPAVTVNGKKRGLADINNGDTLELKNGSGSEGWKTLEVIREEQDVTAVRESNNKAAPRDVTEEIAAREAGRGVPVSDGGEPLNFTPLAVKSRPDAREEKATEGEGEADHKGSTGPRDTVPHAPESPKTTKKTADATPPADKGTKK